TLDQLLRLGLGAGRVAARIRRDQLHLASGQGVVLLLEESGDSLLHLDAALGQWPRLDGQEPDLERRSLRPQHGRHGDRGARGEGALENGSTFDQHAFVSLGPAAWRANVARLTSL